MNRMEAGRLSGTITEAQVIFVDATIDMFLVKRRLMPPICAPAGVANTAGRIRPIGTQPLLAEYGWFPRNRGPWWPLMFAENDQAGLIKGEASDPVFPQNRT